jgi:hypothetical protein
MHRHIYAFFELMTVTAACRDGVGGGVRSIAPGKVICYAAGATQPECQRRQQQVFGNRDKNQNSRFISVKAVVSQQAQHRETRAPNLFTGHGDIQPLKCCNKKATQPASIDNFPVRQ